MRNGLPREFFNQSPSRRSIIAGNPVPSQRGSPPVDMILLDWTRMGRSYCLAGAVADGETYRVVRPLLLKYRDAPVRNVGWSPYLLDGHGRWEVFEVVGPVAAAAQPPHTEDLWVRTLRPHHRLAAPALRRAVLAATLAPPGGPFFGVPFEPTR